MSDGIYDDLADTDLGENILKLERANQALQKHVEKLEGDVHKLCTELTEMKRVQQNLTRNISELFKTAKAEIARKDRMIAELRNELDCLIFKRQSKAVSSEPLLKRPNESFNDSEVKRQKSDMYMYRPEDNRKRHEPEMFDSRYKREDLNYMSDRFKWNAVVNDRRRQIESPNNSRNKYGDFRYASGHSRSHEAHGSYRRSSSRSHHRRSEADKWNTKDTAISADVKIVENNGSAGISWSNNELKLKDELRRSMAAQEDLVDSTVPLQQSSKSAENGFNDVSESGEVVELRESMESVGAPVRESSSGDGTLSASLPVNNSSLGGKNAEKMLKRTKKKRS